MPYVNFGTKQEPGFQLERSDDLLAVRTRSRQPLRAATPVATPEQAEINDGQLVAAFPDAGVEVYRIPTTRLVARPLEERKRSLRESPDVRFAGGVLADPATGDPVLYTENIFIKFVDQKDPDECRAVIAEAGLAIKEEVDYATNAWFAAAPEGTGTAVFDIAQRLLAREDVEFCHPELIRPRARKTIFPQQWHLRDSIVNGIPVSAHASVEAAHQVTRGEGTVIAVIDDGVDIDHLEFASSGKLVAPRDTTKAVNTLGWNDPRPKDPFPQFPENHGTACAGVACADGNHGASGVAPKARLMPMRLNAGLGSMQEAGAFRWAADNGADVISCSWGPPDGDWFDPADPTHTQSVPLPASTRLALDYATANGRNGKGCVILFAAGNGNESVENDGYASYEKVIAVAACNDRGQRSVYSDFGQAVWCAFPSNDFGHQPFSHPAPLTRGIWTTDRSGSKGYNPGNPQAGDAAGGYTNRFGGTSSACPGAAGVAALVLSVNPDLKWHEVKNVLRRACDRIDPQNGNYDVNGHSPLYGHGRLNARMAVDLARPQQQSTITVTRTFNLPLPDLQTVTASLDVAEAAPVLGLAVSVDIRHTFIGDLVITVIPPASLGAGRIRLHNRTGGSTRNLKKTYDAAMVPALAALQNRNCSGTWQLEIRDAAARDIGTLVSFGLQLTLAQPAVRTAAM